MTPATPTARRDPGPAPGPASGPAPGPAPTLAPAPAPVPEPAGARRLRAYGLAVASDLDLPELGPGEGTPAPDLTICRAPGLTLPPEAHGLPAWHAFAPEAACFRWAEVGAFRVSRDGALIEADPAPGVSDALAAFPLLGPVLAEALRRRGLLVLHAGAVEIAGAGIALMADKGVGKSTATAALLSAGARLLADDLAAVATATPAPAPAPATAPATKPATAPATAPGATLLPGFGQLKLSPQTLAALPPPGATPRPAVHPGIGKVRVLVPGLLASGPVPLRRLYVLERGQDARILDLDPSEALPALLRFAYASRFGRQAVDGAAAAALFRQAAALAGRGLVRRLRVPEGLDRLAEALPRAVTRDLAAGG